MIHFFTLYKHRKNSSGSNSPLNKTGLRGFSAVEMVIVVGLGIIVTAISLSAFARFKRGNQVDRSAEQVISLFKTARYQTLSGKDSAFYGIKLASSSVTIYPNRYSASDPGNRVLELDAQTLITGASLSPSTTTISFSRLTGEANATGTITLSLKGNNLIKRIITIHKSGLIE